MITNGPLAGRTLLEAVAEHGEPLLGAARLTADGGFPLLVRRLHAGENMSVQVLPGSSAWVVVHGEPGSVVDEGLPVEVGGLRITPMARPQRYALERIEALAADRWRIETSGMPEVWMVLAGTGRIEAPGGDLDLSRGTTTLIPAALGGRAAARLDEGGAILRITLPSPIEGLLA